jgi:hypothetical protein
MKKIVTFLFLIAGMNFLGAEDLMDSYPPLEKTFSVCVTPKEGQVIRELLETMGGSSLFSLAFKKTYLKDLAKQLRGVSSTQFLGYVLQRVDLTEHMKEISKSSVKWKNLTRSIIRGLDKENKENLQEMIPAFAKFTKGNKNVLMQMANEEDWNGFIIHLLEQN